MAEGEVHAGLEGATFALEDENLAQVATALSGTGWACEIHDPEWRLVWCSDEYLTLIGNPPPEEAGFGRHLIETFLLMKRRNTLTEESLRESLVRCGQISLPETPGGIDGFRRMVGPELEHLADELDPDAPPQLFWDDQVQYVPPGEGAPVPANLFGARIYDEHGEFHGAFTMFGSALPASLQATLVRGDQGLLERTAALSKPAARGAAILFADLEGSGRLSKRLASAAYFRLINELSTRIDSHVIENGGVVGKHAGDGVTAFFLAEHLGSPSAAAKAAIETARGIGEVASCAGVELERVAGFSPDECLMNIGLHWGGALFMGQLVTGGRLEVTALGDEVNECARIQQSARSGEILAAKPLVELLEPKDAQALDLRPEVTSYTTVAELAHADEKAIRDAGSLPVAHL